MKIVQRPFHSCIVGLSISESEETAALGFPVSECNRVMIRIVAAMLGQGASLVLGHDWRDDGIMQAVYSYVERFRPTPSQSRTTAIVRNFVPWPDRPRLPKETQGRLAGAIAAAKAGLPQSLRGCAKRALINHRLKEYIRARSLTHLRHRLTELTTARLCLGGRQKGFGGRFPGIVEEAAFAIRAGQPLYLSGVLGGATQQVILAIKKRNTPKDLGVNAKVRALYASPPVKDSPVGHEDDVHCDVENVWKTFASLGVSGLAKSNGLSAKDNERLFRTQIIDEVIELTLSGLGNILRTAESQL